MTPEYMDTIYLMVIISLASVVLLPLFSWVISHRRHA